MMGDELRGIEEDVRFNWEAAASLEQELRATAGTLDGQVPRRNGFAHDALAEWRGLYSRQFVGRMQICTTDAGRLSSASARADSLRTLYGHWTTELRRSKVGLLLRPNPDFDGDLVGATLPRRAPVQMTAGRGYLSHNGEIEIAQVAMPDGGGARLP
jgi:hypothetical protein